MGVLPLNGVSWFLDRDYDCDLAVRALSPTKYTEEFNVYEAY